jgi:hypothetical protein
MEHKPLAARCSSSSRATYKVMSKLGFALLVGPTAALSVLSVSRSAWPWRCRRNARCPRSAADKLGRSPPDENASPSAPTCPKSCARFTRRGLPGAPGRREDSNRVL